MKLIVDIPDYRYRAIKKIDTTKKPYTINERSAITAIKNGKALEQEPKTGHWNDIPKYKDIAWLCSECEHFTTMKHNYCPECGAKMVEPQESEDKE